MYIHPKVWTQTIEIHHKNELAIAYLTPYSVLATPQTSEVRLMGGMFFQQSFYLSKIGGGVAHNTRDGHG